MKPDDIEAMLHRDNVAFEALSDLLDAHPERTAGDPPWTARDVYAHLAHWANRTSDEIEAHVLGEPPIPDLEDDTDIVNARWQAEDSHMSFREARERAVAAYSRRADLLRGLPETAWDPFVTELAPEDGHEHIDGHFEDMAEAGERQPA